MFRDGLISTYFHLKFNHVEVFPFLTLSHGIRISFRQLKRILRNQGLFRRRNYSNPYEIVSAVERELCGSGSSIGYRLRHHRLRNDYDLAVDKEIVRLILKTLDPKGFERRPRRRLRRRKYYAKGPNYIWHIDGYDELKPLGFCFHGAVDGYMHSRRILWLEASITSNDFSVLAEYYCDCIKQVRGGPRIVRADEGTENCNVAGIQCFFRRNGTMDVQFPIKVLKLGGLFYVKLSLIGRSNSSRIFGTRAYIATVIQFMWNAPNSVLCT